jgi:tetratricopeptide (TPR) repeat protein
MELQTNANTTEDLRTTLVIGFFKEEDVRKGYAFYRGKYYDSIKNLIDTDAIIKSSENKAIGYVIGKDYSDENCYNLHICDIHCLDDHMKIDYIVNGRLAFDSQFITSSLRQIIPAEKMNGPYLPVCAPVQTEILQRFINEETALAKVKPLQKRNDWKGIYDLFSPVSELPQKPNLWNNISVISQLSFATAKLSEVYVNLKHQFSNDEDRKKFLAMKKKYREETIMLRKRCIELEPKKPGHYSNLGYTHYQHVRELLMPGGRRDGNLKEEATKAIEYLNKALELDPQRIPDLYRKGQLLCKVTPNQKLFAGGCRNPKEEQIKGANNDVTEGIGCYQRIKEVWEILPVLEDKMTKRYQKEYIKGLYNMACAYGDLAPELWDSSNYLNINDEMFTREASSYERAKVELIDKALTAMEECCASDNAALETTFRMPEPIVTAKFNGFAEGVFKLYNTGKLYLQKYLILSGGSADDKNEASACLEKAEKYLRASLNFNWSKDLTNQSKDFIAERLARVLIIKGEFNEAVNTIRKHIRKFSMYYIRYTLSVALIRCGRNKEAEEELALAMKFEKSNAELWKGHFIRFASSISEGKYDEAYMHLKKADEAAKNCGKRSLERLMLGRSYLHKCKGENEKSAEVLNQLRSISPTRNGVVQKLKNAVTAA